MHDIPWPAKYVPLIGKDSATLFLTFRSPRLSTLSYINKILNFCQFLFVSDCYACLFVPKPLRIVRLHWGFLLESKTSWLCVVKNRTDKYIANKLQALHCAMFLRDRLKLLWRLECSNLKSVIHETLNKDQGKWNWLNACRGSVRFAKVFSLNVPT